MKRAPTTQPKKLFELPNLYDEVFDWDASAEIDYITRSLGPYRNGLGIEYGCGTGRITLPLLARGFALTAVDASAPAVTVLSERAPDSEVLVADFTVVSWPQRFLYALAGLNTLRYLLDMKALDSHIRAAGSSLQPGGHYVVHVDSFGTAGTRSLPGAGTQWTGGRPSEPVTVQWSLVDRRIGPGHDVDIEHVEVRRNGVMVLSEYQRQLALPLSGWRDRFERDGLWTTVGIDDERGVAVEGSQVDRAPSGNYWFHFERTDLPCRPDSAFIMTGDPW